MRLPSSRSARRCTTVVLPVPGAAVSSKCEQLELIGPLVLEALLEVAAAFEVALLEDPGIAAVRIRKHFPGVVVRVPEEKAVGAVALARLADVVQAPFLCLLIA